jgi:UPF0755 protein
MRVLGIDPGSRRVGVAVSDEDGIIASPHATLQVKSQVAVAAAIGALARELVAERIVIGLPLRLDGGEGESSRRARVLAALIGEHAGLPVVMWDERLTTRAAERALREGHVRGKDQRALVDQVAAALLLQSYLDAQRPREGRVLVRVLAALVLLVLAALLAAAGWLMMEYPHHHGPGSGKVVELSLPAGTDLRTVAAELAQHGALAEPHYFELYARARDAQPRLRKGTVLLYDNMTALQLLQRVAQGFGSTELRVVIPEGFSRYEIAARLERWGICERSAFLNATEDRVLLSELAIDGPSAEGWLFPDTYELRDSMEPSAVIRRLVGNARRRLAPLLTEQSAQLERVHSELGFGVQQLMILASIVEKEAKVPAEQATIAGVFYNRLRDPAFLPKRLQADPTVAYGCALQPSLPSCAGSDGKLVTHAMLSDPENPYNTYRRDGLPPGPIANPGLRAIAAALNPEAHDYYYFVASGDGRHSFSHSLEAHHAATEAARTP